jgi:hypothetical protein
MDIDFGALLGGASSSPTNPRDLFLSLDKDQGFSFLRDVQSDVLDKWFEDPDRKDSVIKLNVGSGKTVVGLLILQSSLNAGVGPAVYVCPDNLLVEQVLSEAGRLNIPVTNDASDPLFRSSKRILVINVHKLFNGKSVFGVGEQRIEIGALIIDDAHACLLTINDQFKISLPNSHPVYKWCLQTFGPVIERQNTFGHLAICNADPQAFEEVPFWSVQEHASQLLANLYQHRDDEQLLFTLPFLKNILPYCRVVIGGSYLEIQPVFPPTDLIDSFHRAKRRIYMTATLSDDSVLVTHFGADPSKLKEPITPASLQAMGERMIIMPQELNAEFKIGDLQELLVAEAASHNVVVIVPSQKAAAEWAAVAQQILVGDSVSAGVGLLRTQHVGLTVLINRYDGIDLPQTACRVLAIVGLPEASSLVGRLDASVLGGSAVALRRQMQRIEQGMGRGVRSADDYCAVVLFGSDLTRRIISKEGHDMLTPATQAQVNLSKQLATQMVGANVHDLRSVISKVMQRDRGWVAASKNALLQAPRQPGLRIEKSQTAVRQAFDAQRYNEHTEAAAILTRAANDVEDDAYKAWLKVRLAEATNFFDPGEAQRILQSANRLNRRVLRPVEGVSYEKVRGSKADQVIAVQNFFRDRFLQGPERILFAQSLAERLIFEPGTSEQFEAAVLDLGKALGLHSQRPEREYNEGPDNLWLLKDGRYLVIECKNGSTTQQGISKDDLGQLEQGMTWFRRRYGSDVSVLPVIIHPLTAVGYQATALEGLRIIDVQRLDLLRRSFVDLVKMIAADVALNDAVRVRGALTNLQLTENTFLDRFTVSPR